MPDVSHDASQRYRVWIVDCQDWRPNYWEDVPPRYRAVELAVHDCLSQDAATHWLEGFNGAMLSAEAGLCADSRLWAIAVAVQLRYEGDLAAGQIVAARRLTCESTADQRI